MEESSIIIEGRRSQKRQRIGTSGEPNKLNHLH